MDIRFNLIPFVDLALYMMWRDWSKIDYLPASIVFFSGSFDKFRLGRLEFDWSHVPIRFHSGALRSLKVWPEFFPGVRSFLDWEIRDSVSLLLFLLLLLLLHLVNLLFVFVFLLFSCPRHGHGRSSEFAFSATAPCTQCVCVCVCVCVCWRCSGWLVVSVCVCVCERECPVGPLFLPLRLSVVFLFGVFHRPFPNFGRGPSASRWRFCLLSFLPAPPPPPLPFFCSPDHPVHS